MFHVKHNIMNRIQRLKFEKEFVKRMDRISKINRSELELLDSVSNKTTIIDPEVHVIYEYDIINGLTAQKK